MERLGIGIDFSVKSEQPLDRSERAMIRSVRRHLLKLLWVHWWSIPKVVRASRANGPVEERVEMELGLPTVVSHD